MILVRIASFVLSQQLDPQMTSAAPLQHLDHCSPTLRILQVRSVHRSWETEIDGRFGDNLRLDYEIDFVANRNVGCDVGSETGALVNEIFPSVIY